MHVFQICLIHLQPRASIFHRCCQFREAADTLFYVMLSNTDGEGSNVKCQKIIVVIMQFCTTYMRHLLLHCPNIGPCMYRVHQNGACCINSALSLTDLCNDPQDFEHDMQSPSAIKTVATGKSVPATDAWHLLVGCTCLNWTWDALPTSWPDLRCAFAISSARACSSRSCCCCGSGLQINTCQMWMYFTTKNPAHDCNVQNTW